jgi:hypothetical protein
MRTEHDELVAARARAIASAPAHASPWHASTAPVDAEPSTLRPPPSLAKRNGNRRSRRSDAAQLDMARRVETRAALVGRTVQSPSGPITFTEEQVNAMSDDEATEVLASAEAQDAAAARTDENPEGSD